MFKVNEVLKDIKIDGRKGFILGFIVIGLVVIDKFFYPSLLEENKDLWEIHIMQALFFFFLVIAKSDIKKVIFSKINQSKST